jgi:outer membrane protein assembly factor BamB
VKDGALAATPKQKGMSRREFLPKAAGVAAVGAAGVIGYELHPSGGSPPPKQAPAPAPAPAPPAGSSQVRTFVTRPDLRPPAVTVTPVGSLSSQSSTPPYIFVAPTNYVPDAPAQQGLMILDRTGRLVWFSPVTDGKPFDFNTQSYQGKPALTWWQGEVTGAHGLGVGEIADSSYRTIANVKAGDGLMTDLHELNLTSSGTALITAYETTTADLSSVGQKRTGKVFVGHAQEIDLKTGKVLFDWRSLDHVPLNESYQNPPANPKSTFDYFHINSVTELDDGNLLISGRNTWALYKVDRSSGKVIWRLNGKRSNFTVSTAARFYWQHHARAQGTTGLTVFDNAGPKKERQSRGLSLSVDTRAMHVDLSQAYIHPARFLSNTLGSVQLLDDGRVFVGWGDQPYFSEFAPDGTLLLTGQMPIGVRSYRTFAANWVGQPVDPPRVVAKANPASGFVVWASWNGATEIDSWTVLAGTNKSSLTPVGSQPWGGFETAIAVNSTGPYFAVAAIDRNGKELGRSAVV